MALQGLDTTKLDESVQEAKSSISESSRRLISTAEQQAEQQKAAIREQQKQAQRQRSLPISKPVRRDYEADISSVESSIRQYKKEVEKSKQEAHKEIESQKQESIQSAKKEMEKQLEGYVKLDNGEYVDKVMYGGLTKEQQSYLKTNGIEKFNAWAKKQAEQQIKNAQTQATEGLIALNNAEQQIKNAQTQATEGLIALNNGEYVSKDVYNNLTKEEQDYLKVNGVDKFNTWLNKKAEQEFDATHIKVGTGSDEYITKEAYNSLNAEQQQKIKELGVKGFNNWIKSQYQELKNGELVSKASWDELSYSDKLYLLDNGIEAFNKYQNEKLAKDNVQLNSGEWVSKEWYDGLKPLEQYDLKKMGYEAFTDKYYIKLKDGSFVAKKGLSKEQQQKLASVNNIDEYVNWEMGKENTKLKNGEWVNTKWFNTLTSPEQIYLYNNGVEKFEREYYVKSSKTGEYVTKEYYNSLSSREKNEFHNGGIAALQKYLNETYITFDVTGESMLRADYDKLSSLDKLLIRRIGVAKFNEQKQAEFESKHIQVGDGKYVEKAALAGLSTEDIAYIKAHGVDAFNALKQQEAEQFKATHKIIGEQAMTNEDWNNLSAEYKAIAEARGFDFLQARIEADKVKFEKEHIKLATGEYIPLWSSKDEDGNKIPGYNNLTAEQQEYIYNNGVAKFNEKYGSPDYTKLEAEFLSLTNEQILSYMQASGYPAQVAIFNAKAYFKKLNDATKQKILNYYAQSEGKMPTVMDVISPFVSAFTSTMISVVPVVGTIVHWNEMNDAMRAVSIVTDILSFIPLAKITSTAVKTAIAPTRTAVKSIMATEAKLIAKNIKLVQKTYGIEMANALKKVYDVQSTFISELAKVADLEKKLAKVEAKAAKLSKATASKVSKVTASKVSNVQLSKIKETTLPKLKNDIVTAKAKVLKAENNLIKTTENFKGIAGKTISVDSKAVSTVFSELPKTLVESSKAIVEAASTPKINAKVLKAQVAKAEDSLNEVQKQYPDKPEMWIDKVTDLVVAQSKLNSFLTGGLEELYEKLSKLKAKLKATKNAKEITKIKLQIKEIEAKIIKQLKSSEVLYGEGGGLKGASLEEAKKPLIGGGGGGSGKAVIAEKQLVSAVSKVDDDIMAIKGRNIKPKVVTPSMLKGTLAIATSKPAIQHLGANETARLKTAMEASAIKAIEGAKVVPTTSAQLKQSTSQQLKSLSAIATNAAVNAKIAGKTSANIQSEVKTAVNKAISTISNTATKAAIQSQVKSIVSSAIKAASNVKPVSRTAVSIKAGTATSTATVPATSIQSATKPATKPATKSATKVATKVTTKPAVKTKVKKVVRVKKDDEEEKATGITEKQLKGSIGWKQGIMYILTYPPFGKNDIKYSRKPIKGGNYSGTTPQESIFKSGGEVPDTILRDMGIFDISIKSRGKNKKPKISFKRDLKQKTNLSRIISTRI